VPSIGTPTRQAFAKLGAGVNLGNMLDAPHEGDWGSRVQDGYPAAIRQAGFGHVRLPVRWSAHAGRDASAQIDPVFMARVDDVVDRLLAQGLTVVLDMHHYRQLDGDPLDPGDLEVNVFDLKSRFLSMWQQIAEHFSGRSERLWFELYNEPHGLQTATAWNDLASRALRVVRASNPERVVVIGPAQWNSARALESLTLPADANLVVTIHDYEPFLFTHQGATWNAPLSARPTGVRCCDAQQRQQLTEPLAIAARWAERHGVPLWLGEFGSYGGPSTQPNDMVSRAEYTRLVRDAAEERGIAWAYWEFDSGFGIYDRKTRQWREPLRRALLAP
jgi:endoglucanase